MSDTYNYPAEVERDEDDGSSKRFALAHAPVGQAGQRDGWGGCVMTRLMVLAAAGFWTALASDAAAQGSVDTDRAALVALYDATGGPDWTNSTNWKTAAPLDAWHGVTTNAAGRVRELDLEENMLAGPIPDELGNLANLEGLDLTDNSLTGPIPRTLGDLPRLRSLHLSGNALTGPIPRELGNLENLEHLILNSNDLTGSLPPSLGKLARLRWLYAWYNGLTGPIPRELGDLANLEHLALRGNELTGSIPRELGDLAKLERLYLDRNALTGPIPRELGSLVNLERLDLAANELTGPIPRELGDLENLERLEIHENWGISGTLPTGLRSAPLERLDIFFTQACAPPAWRDRLETIEFDGVLCGVGAVTIDVAAIYTSAAREAAGGVAAIEALIELKVAETNQSYEASGIRHRVALVNVSEVSYAETGDSLTDIRRLQDPSDGHMDEVHALRDEVAADLVSLTVDGHRTDSSRGDRPGPFTLIRHHRGGDSFAHELGHNMGIRHDRHQESERSKEEGYKSKRLWAHPAYGYVNQRGFEPGAAESSRWKTVMAYPTQCRDAGVRCLWLFRFSNPRQRYNGDPLGVAYGNGESGLNGPADAVSVINVTGPAIAGWRGGLPDAGQPGANRPPTAVRTLPDRTLAADGTLDVDVSQAFADPDGDALTYTVSSSAPDVVTVRASGARVTITPVDVGTAVVRVTATDPGGLSATLSFGVTVRSGGGSRPFTDHPVRPGVTPVRAVHFTELRSRIDALRTAAGLGRFAWTDPVLTPGVTPVRLVHLLELRAALSAMYEAAGRNAPAWTDAVPTGGTTPIRAAHLMELRAAVDAAGVGTLRSADRGAAVRVGERGAAGQSAGLFRPAVSAAVFGAAGSPDSADSLMLRRRLVSVDFGQLAPGDSTATGAASAGRAGVLQLNLFDDAVFTGLVERVEPTFSGGHSLSGPLSGVDFGTMTLVVNGEVVAGTVRTPEATYRIRPAGAGLHAVSQVDLARLPPPSEPIPGQRWGRDRSSLEPDPLPPPR